MRPLYKFFLVLFSVTTFASLPQSLEEYIATNPTWEKDISSKSFIATRCSVINILAAERSGSHPNAQSLAKTFNESASVFAMYSDYLYKLGGGETEQFHQRAAHWANVYGQEAVDNINTYNDMTHGEFGEDLMFCNQAFMNFVSKDINNLSKE
jgi:hypothetical protein